MGVDCRIHLPEDVRVGNVTEAIGILAGLKPILTSIPSVNVKGATVKGYDSWGLATCANIEIEATPLTKMPHLATFPTPSPALGTTRPTAGSGTPSSGLSTPCPRSPKPTSPSCGSLQLTRRSSHARANLSALWAQVAPQGAAAGQVPTVPERTLE